MNIHSDATLAATIEGVRNMPIPTTSPTMIVIASKTDNTA
jgi:hypothetical protein